MFIAKTLYSKKFSAADIQVDILPNARWTVGNEYEEQVSRTWKARVQTALNAKVTIWDGMYYRVTNVTDIANTAKILLRLGTIPYRYIATLPDLQDQFNKDNLEPTFHLSTATMMRTVDGKYIFGKRSLNGNLDLIGGGVQPDEIEVKSGIDLEKNLLKEIAEESGIYEHQIQGIQGIGIVHSVSSNIILIFLTQLTLSELEANNAFKTRSDDEMSDLIFIAEEDIKSFLKELPSYRPLIADLLEI